MARFIRFIVYQRVEGKSQRVGLFTAAYFLHKEDLLDPHDRERLAELLAWFEAELTVPPEGKITRRAIFWYRDAVPFSRRMWELAQLLEEYAYTTELITTKSVGRVLYQDKHQVAAVPRRVRLRAI